MRRSSGSTPPRVVALWWLSNCIPPQVAVKPVDPEAAMP
jgi:hypothetical protein